MTEQFELWDGGFGDDYTERNRVEPKSRVASFREMLQGLNIDRVLEIGCNKGHNLTAIRTVLPSVKAVGIEVNAYALSVACEETSGVEFLRADMLHLPVRDMAFDLVFTSGVLIHVASSHLRAAVSQIYRASRRYVLAIEYFSEEDVEIVYRGRRGFLWKRDFGKHYESQCRGLTILRHGFWGPDEGFDNCDWWLMEKSEAPY